MIRNPYPPPRDEDKISCRFQTYLSGEDKGLLSSIRPIRGTPQAVVNHLIKNLCNDLRDIGLTAYHPDADDIFCILVERRPITAEQRVRIRRALASTNKQIPTGVRQHSGGSSVRQGLTGDALSAHNTSSQVAGGKQHHSKAESKTKAGTTSKTKRR